MKRFLNMMAAAVVVVLGLSVSSPAAAQGLGDLIPGIGASNIEGVVTDGLIDLGLSLLRKTKPGDVQEQYVYGVLPLDSGVTVEVRLRQASAESARRVEEAWARVLDLDPSLALQQLEDAKAFEIMLAEKVVTALQAADCQVVLSHDDLNRWSQQRTEERRNPEVRGDSVPAGGDLERPLVVVTVSFTPLAGFETEEWVRLVLARELSTLTSEVRLDFAWADTGVSLGSIVVPVETHDIQAPRRNRGQQRLHARPVTHAHLTVAGNVAVERMRQQAELFRRVGNGEVGLYVDQADPTHMRLVEMAGLPDPRVFAVYTGGYALVTAGKTDHLAEGTRVEIGGHELAVSRVADNFSTIRLMGLGVGMNEAVGFNSPVKILLVDTLPGGEPAVTPEPVVPATPTTPTVESWRQQLPKAKVGDVISLPEELTVESALAMSTDGGVRPINVQTMRLVDPKRGRIVRLEPPLEASTDDPAQAPANLVLVGPVMPENGNWVCLYLEPRRKFTVEWTMWQVDQSVAASTTPSSSVARQDPATFLNAVNTATPGTMLSDSPKFKSVVEMKKAKPDWVYYQSLDTNKERWEAYQPGKVGRLRQVSPKGEVVRELPAVVVLYTQASGDSPHLKYTMHLWVITEGGVLPSKPNDHRWVLGFNSR